MNLIEVTKAEFYKVLYADKRDIMPSIVSGWNDISGYTSEWRLNGHSGSWIFGRHQSGNAHGRDEGKKFWLNK